MYSRYINRASELLVSYTEDTYSQTREYATYICTKIDIYKKRNTILYLHIQYTYVHHRYLKLQTFFSVVCLTLKKAIKKWVV